MSASSKKKLRKEQNAAAMSERQKQEKKEARNLKAMTITFAIVMVLVVAIVVGVVVTPLIEGLYYRNKHSITVGDHKVSATELSYFYIDAISQHYNEIKNQYSGSFGNYWTIMLGFDPAKPMNAQTTTTGGTETWADYFLKKAIDAAKDTYALYDDAMAKGYQLTEADQKELDDSLSYLQLYAQFSGLSSVDSYLRSLYGKGANEETYKEYSRIRAIATAYYNDYAGKLEYKLEDYRKFEEGKLEDYDVVSYIHYTLNISSYLGEGTKDENNKPTWTDAEKEAARAKLIADIETLKNAGITDKDSFNNALQNLAVFNTTETDKKDETETDNKDDAETDNKDEAESDKKDDTETDKKDETTSTAKKPTGTEVTDAYFKNITLHAGALEWLKKAERKPGEFNAFEVYSYPDVEDPNHEHGDDCGCARTVDGYTIVLFVERDDQKTNLVNVRHILVAFEGGTTGSDGKKTYTDEEKAKAKAEAEAILKEWQDGKANEDSFAALANAKSDDQGGKVTNGGLYEDVYPGQMVEAFEKWCFDETREVGNTDIVETEHGYHVMYYSAKNEKTYRDMLIERDLRKSDAEKWHDDLVGKMFFEQVDVSLIPFDYQMEKDTHNH